MKKKILCTGGAGYIGSHTAVALSNAGYEVDILDDLSNSSAAVIGRISKIVGNVRFHQISVNDTEKLANLFATANYDGVVHFAALKSVGESCKMPLEYYVNNVQGTLSLLQCMKKAGCTNIVYSSSATVYRPAETPLVETDALGPCNPYGHSKLMCEQVLEDLAASDKSWRVSILRYFNPVGAHPSGTIGESPQEPNNILPYIQQVAVGRRDHLNVFGNDWGTRDGTGVRDYVHVEDLAEGHVAALRWLFGTLEGSCAIHNLGTGQGVSVLELVKYFEAASGKPIPYKVIGRRQGDLATVIADPSKANKELSWHATRSIEDACQSAWKWQSTNPYGYEEPPINRKEN